MIAVDSSALIAVVFGEPDRDRFFNTINDSPICLVSSVSVVETRMVVFERRGPTGLKVLGDLLGLPAFQVTPPGPEDVEAAFAAFLRYGKGRGHPAQLNLGDVFSYALAKTRGLPLLFKGEDFARTDIASA